MKTSAILLSLLVFNTSLLLAEPLAALLNGINPWILGGSEILLIAGYYLHVVLRDVRKAFDVDLNNLEVFVFKGKDKKGGK